MKTDWMDLRVWRFWFRTAEEAARVCRALRQHFAVDWYRRHQDRISKATEVIESCRRYDKEVRLRYLPHINRPPDIGVLPAGPRLVRVHFANVGFYCTRFVYRQTVYDLTFDGKPRTCGRNVILNTFE